MILAGFSFGFVFLITQGTAEFAQYETAFFLEKLLSIDNLAVIATLFTAFKATTAEQHKALNYGIAGAIIMRLVFILIGAEALERYEFMSIVFGVILGYSGYKMIKSDHDETDEPKIVSKIRSRFPQISTLLMLILAVELTDIIFAVDSVPAVLSVQYHGDTRLTSIVLCSQRRNGQDQVSKPNSCGRSRVRRIQDGYQPLGGDQRTHECDCDFLSIRHWDYSFVEANKENF